MKNYKQILEAVNRGIQLALDDFDDEEQVQNIKSKQVNHRDYTKEYLDFQKLAKNLISKKISEDDIINLAAIHKIIGQKIKIPVYKLFEIIRFINKNESLWNINLNWLDTSEILTMQNLFWRSPFTGDISQWDTANVKNMSQMFLDSAFNRDISNWDVFSCRNFEEMFMNDSEFQQDLSSWKIKKGSKTGMMFWGTKTVNNLKFMPQFI